MTEAEKTNSYKKKTALTKPRVVIVGGAFGGLMRDAGLAGASDDSKWITGETLLISRGYIRLYRQTVQQQERETKI